MANNHYPSPESIHRRVLANGITVLAYENFAAELVVIEGLVRAGALAEGRDMAGLAGFTAECLLRGTQQRTFEQIYEELESVGADLGFSGGRHATDFSGSALVEDFDLLLKLLAESLRYPTFPAGQVEQVRGQILTGLHMRANDTRRMAGLAFRELLYGDHPYGYSADGYVETIRTIGRDELAQFHTDYYGPQGMIVTVVGAVKADDALTRVETAFGDWLPPQQKTLPTVPPAARPPDLTRRIVPMPGKTQTDVVLGLPGPLRSVPDYQEARLMNTILGVFGMMGRLGETVREKQGLAYYVHSQLQGGLGPSPWTVSTGVAPDQVEQAIQSILHEIGRIQEEPVPEEELADSQAFLTGSLPVSLETNEGLASILTDMELYELGLDYLQRYPGMIQAITPAQVQAAARKYLSASQLAIAIAGPNTEG